jgi:hypothetical protein
VDIRFDYRLLVGGTCELHKPGRDWNVMDGEKPENILHDESKIDDVSHETS